jgi:hypothetical protein
MTSEPSICCGCGAGALKEWSAELSLSSLEVKMVLMVLALAKKFLG